MRKEIKPEERYPHRFDEWPTLDRIAYLSNPQVFTREFLTQELGRLLDEGELADADLGANKRVPMGMLARAVVAARDTQRLIERQSDRISELEKDVSVLQDRLERLRDRES